MATWPCKQHPRLGQQFGASQNSRISFLFLPNPDIVPVELLKTSNGVLQLEIPRLVLTRVELLDVQFTLCFATCPEIKFIKFVKAV